jgi:hypothetical protein
MIIEKEQARTTTTTIRWNNTKYSIYIVTCTNEEMVSDQRQ